MKLKEIREKFPQYDALSDDELARALHTKFYSQLDFKDFSSRVGYIKGSNPGEYDPQSSEFRKKYGAQSESDFQNFRAGWGKAAVDLGRGAGQLVGLVSRDDVADSRVRDADLLRTKAGTAGNISGSVANMVPAAFIPGANTLAGAAAIGAGAGALAPSVSTQETLTNTALGGVLSPAAMLAGRGISAAYRGGKALFEPLTKGGQERIAARTAEAFAGGRQSAQAAAEAIRRNSANVLPGVQATTAELAENAGLSQLERSLKNNPELLTAFTDRAAANKNVLLNSIDDIAGDATKRQAAVAAREAAAKPLYEAAKAVTVKTDDELKRLLARPSATNAWARAQSLASEAGDALDVNADEISGKTLHYLKMAMDDIADNPQASGIAGNEARAIRGTRDTLLSWIEKKVPDYKAARTTFAEKSKPINQMDIGSALRDKLQPALADFGATTRIRPQAYAQALRDADALAAKTLDRSNAKLADVLTQDQIKKLTQVGEQLARRANADELGKAAGSNTGQNLVSQNVMRQFLGPFGLPESTMQRAAESTLMQSAMRPAQWAGKLGEQRAIGVLAEASLDPKLAIKLLEAGVPPEAVGMLRYQGLLGPSVVSGTDAARQ